MPAPFLNCWHLSSLAIKTWVFCSIGVLTGQVCGVQDKSFCYRVGWWIPCMLLELDLQKYNGLNFILHKNLFLNWCLGFICKTFLVISSCLQHMLEGMAQWELRLSSSLKIVAFYAIIAQSFSMLWLSLRHLFFMQNILTDLIKWSTLQICQVLMSEIA